VQQVLPRGWEVGKIQCKYIHTYMYVNGNRPVETVPGMKGE
jgi:hypothetical protein